MQIEEDDTYARDLILVPQHRHFSLDRPAIRPKQEEALKQFIFRLKFPELAAAQDPPEPVPAAPPVVVDDGLDEEALVQKI